MEYQREMEEINIQLQQEAYIARVLGQKSDNNCKIPSISKRSASSYSIEGQPNKLKTATSDVGSTLGSKKKHSIKSNTGT